MNTIKQLQDLEQKLVSLAPDLKTKPFGERTELDDQVAQIQTVISSAIHELLNDKQEDSEEYCKLIIEENRERIEALVDEYTAADTLRSGEIPDEIA